MTPTAIVGPCRVPIAGAVNSTPSVWIETVYGRTLAHSRTHGATTAEIVMVATAAAELSHENRGVSTIAIASAAATPGAIRTGEYIRARKPRRIALAITTIPGRGTLVLYA